MADDELANNNLLKALELYTQLLSKGQKSVNVLSCRAAILIELKEYEKAKKDVEELIQLDPQNPKVSIHRGIVSLFLMVSFKARVICLVILIISRNMRH